MSMNVMLHGESTTETITLSDGTTKAAPEKIKVISGSVAIASVGVSGTVYTQTATNTGTRSRFTFNPPIKACNISILAGADVAAFDEGLVYCFDAPTTVIADDWLTETNIAPRLKIKQVDGIRSHYFNGATVTYVDIRAVGTGVDMDVTVEGIV